MATNKKITLTLDTFFKIQCTEFFEALGCQVLTEVELFKQPRRLDVLIIEGGGGEGRGASQQPLLGMRAKHTIHKKFHLLDYFQKYNLVSYKSFRDRFSISDIRDAMIYHQSYLNLEKKANEANSTVSLIVSQKPSKFLSETTSKVSQQVKGRYVIDYQAFKVYILNIEEAPLNDSLDGVFLSEFVKDKKKITMPADVRRGLVSDKKIVDILEEGLKTRLVTFEGRILDMGAVADITKYVLPELEKAEARGKAEGKTEGKAEIFKKMYANGQSISQISSMTGLSEAECQRMLSFTHHEGDPMKK